MSAIRVSDHKFSHTIHRPLSAALLCASLAVVAICGLLALVPAALFAAKGAFEQKVPTVTQCEMLNGDAARLSCFDQLGKQALQPPAKGALAPPLPH